MPALPKCVALLVACLLCGVALGQARSDAAREQRWADQIVPGLVVGDAVYLDAPGAGKFLAIYAPGHRTATGVLLAHGPGLHPDHGITGELRMALADRGFPTLSLQMPVLAAEVDDGAAYQALYPEAAARIAAGLRFLQARGAKRVALVTHAMGSGMAYAYLADHRDAPVFAWAALSFYGVYDRLGGPGFPILDLYGAADYRGIRGPAAERLRILAQRPGSRQLAVPEGGRFLAGGEKTVLREVGAFLDAAAR